MAILPLASILTHPTAASAHVSTIGYSRISADREAVTWTLWLDPFHLNTFLRLDADDNGDVTAAEIDSQATAIRTMAASGLEVVDSGTGERPRAATSTVALTTMAETGLEGDEFTTLGAFPLIEVPVRFEFGALHPADVQLTYGLFLAAGFGDHNNVAEVDLTGATSVVTFSPEEPAFLVGDLGNAGQGAEDTGRAFKPFVLLFAGVVLTAAIAFFRRRVARTHLPHSLATSVPPLRRSR